MQKQQPLAGFLFSLMAVIMWGTLPIALQPVLKEMNAQTIVWFRFVVAMFGVFFMLSFAKKLPKLTALSRKDLGLLLLGIAGLSGNFFLFNVALRYIPATASQVLSPLSSFAMILLGAFLFKEQIRLNQKLGFIIVVIGLLLFFHNRFADFSQMNGYAFGILCGMTASLIWIGYGLSQRLLLERFNSMQILLMIYIGCSLVFTPLADFSQAVDLSTFAAICLVYCCLNTIIAYGTYAEALNRWDVSKVSIMMPLIPIFTMIFSELAYFWKPESFTPPDLSFLTVLGACLVVFGALFSAVGHKLLHRRRVKK
nr:DMT family transporter [uncultured Haemophilus sp.]